MLTPEFSLLQYLNIYINCSTLTTCLSLCTAHLATREEKSEQMLDCRHELEDMEAELKRIQQEVRRTEE